MRRASTISLRNEVSRFSEKTLCPSLASVRKLRRQRLLYVDKKALRIADLARPRRFGKFLLVSTLEVLLKGERELFADARNPNLLAAMYQIGYLKLARNVAGSRYELVFPTRKVEQTFVEALIGEQRPGEAVPAVTMLVKPCNRTMPMSFSRMT